MKHFALLAAVIGLAGPLLPQSAVQFDSPSRIVFSSDMSGNKELYLISGGRLTRLTDNPAADEWPVPDGKGENIVFTSDRAGSYDIYVLNLKTGDTRRLTSDPRDELSPSWSADGRFVYYDLMTGRNVSKTMKLDPRTGISTILLPDPPFGSTIVSFPNPAGTEIFFTGKVFLGWLVAKYDLAAGRYTELTKKGSCRPKVSPDGKKVAYVCHDDDGLGDVFLMNPDGSGKVNATASRRDFHDYYPCFSPDSSKIVFSSSPRNRGKDAYQLHVLDLKTGEVRRILTSKGNDSFPYWFD
jgi:Tol biopolymer transport system component